MSVIYKHVPHPHIELRKLHGPVQTADVHAAAAGEGLLARFNTWLAIKITKGVATMWCAYVFAAIALITLPNAIRGGANVLVPWIAQTFIQLVLLAIIMVGQDVLSKAADLRAQQTFDDAEAVLHTALQIEAHLQAQDTALTKLVNTAAK